MSNAPTLFLDYDGVLHPDAVYRVRGEIVLQRDGHTLFECSPLLIEALAPHPDIRIVLSTSWVRVLGFNKACKRLPQTLRERVIGATWHSDMDAGEWQTLTRFSQVTRYAHHHRVERWLAVDDDAQGWFRGYHDNLVHTHSDFGLALASTRKELQEKLLELTTKALPQDGYI